MGHRRATGGRRHGVSGSNAHSGHRCEVARGLSCWQYRNPGGASAHGVGANDNCRNGNDDRGSDRQKGEAKSSTTTCCGHSAFWFGPDAIAAPGPQHRSMHQRISVRPPALPRACALRRRFPRRPGWWTQPSVESWVDSSGAVSSAGSRPRSRRVVPRRFRTKWDIRDVTCLPLSYDIPATKARSDRNRTRLSAPPLPPPAAALRCRP